MKRKLVLLMVLSITTTGIISTFAEEPQSQQKEILFREVPWGSDMNTAESIIGDYDYYRSSSDTYAYKSNYFLKNKYEHAENDGTATNEMFYPDGMKVAGYDVSDIELNYVYIFPDGIVDDSTKTTALQSAKYSFECVDYGLAGEDLRDKLSGLYGEAIQLEEDDTKKYIWNGANGTACVLDIETDDYPKCDLTYVWVNGDELVDAADEAFSNKFKSEESTIYGNGDNSGL